MGSDQIPCSGQKEPLVLEAHRTTVAQCGSREYAGWRVKPPELRARKPRSNGSPRSQQTLHRWWSTVSEKREEQHVDDTWQVGLLLQTNKKSRSEQNCTVGKPTAPDSKQHQRMLGRRCISRKDHHLLKNKQLIEQTTHRQRYFEPPPWQAMGANLTTSFRGHARCPVGPHLCQVNHGLRRPRWLEQLSCQEEPPTTQSRGQTTPPTSTILQSQDDQQNRRTRGENH